MLNVRVYDSGEGRYIHAEDFIALLEKGREVADPVTAVVIPRMIALVKGVESADSFGRPTPVGPTPPTYGWTAL